MSGRRSRGVGPERVAQLREMHLGHTLLGYCQAILDRYLPKGGTMANTDLERRLLAYLDDGPYYERSGFVVRRLAEELDVPLFAMRDAVRHMVSSGQVAEVRKHTRRFALALPRDADLLTMPTAQLGVAPPRSLPAPAATEPTVPGGPGVSLTVVSYPSATPPAPTPVGGMGDLAAALLTKAAEAVTEHEELMERYAASVDECALLRAEVLSLRAERDRLADDLAAERGVTSNLREQLGRAVVDVDADLVGRALAAATA